MNEDLVRWIAAVVIKVGGEVELSNEELNHAIDLKFEVVENGDGDSTGLRITARIED